MDLTLIAKNIMGWQVGIPTTYSPTPWVEYIEELRATLLTYDGHSYVSWRPQDSQGGFDKLLKKAEEKGLIYITVPVDNQTTRYKLIHGIDEWIFVTNNKQFARERCLKILIEIARKIDR